MTRTRPALNATVIRALIEVFFVFLPLFVAGFVSYVAEKLGEFWSSADPSYATIVLNGLIIARLSEKERKGNIIALINGMVLAFGVVPPVVFVACIFLKGHISFWLTLAQWGWLIASAVTSFIFLSWEPKSET